MTVSGSWNERFPNSYQTPTRNDDFDAGVGLSQAGRAALVHRRRKSAQRDEKVSGAAGIDLPGSDGAEEGRPARLRRQNPQPRRLPNGCSRPEHPLGLPRAVRRREGKAAAGNSQHFPSCCQC